MKIIIIYFFNVLILCFCVQPFASTPRGEPQSLVFSPTPAKEPPHTNGAVKEPLMETPKRPATKSTNGPPVYYPPNHDMFTKKDAPVLVSS